MHYVNWNRQLGLALILFILGTGAYWLEYKHKPQQEASDEAAKRIFNLKDTPVHSVSLITGSASATNSPNLKTLTLGCVDVATKLCKPGDNSKWEVREPLKLKADDANVNALLSTLNTLNPTETIDLKEETPEKRAALLKEYGLDSEARKSAKRVQITTGSGTSVLYLGQQHPIGDSIFGLQEKSALVQNSQSNSNQSSVNENLVYLIPTYFKSNLEHELTYWRDKKLVALGAHEVEAFELTGPKERLSAEKKKGEWVLRSGKEEFSGDLDGIDSFLSAAVFLTAKTFVSDHKNDARAKNALKNYSPALSVQIQKEKGLEEAAPKPFVITLYQGKKGSQATKVYATVSNLDPLFEIEGGSINRLNKTAKDLRLTKLITSMERFSTKRLEFGGVPMGANPLILSQKNGKWVTEGDPSEISEDKAQAVLEKLGGNRIKDFLSSASSSEGEKEGLQVTLGDETNASKRQLLFWKKGDKLYAKDLQSKRGEVFLVEDTVRDALPWNRNFFKK